MQEGNRSQSQNRDSQGRQSQAHLTSLALRSIGQVYDMNLSAARVLLQTQARAASAGARSPRARTRSTRWRTR